MSHQKILQHGACHAGFIPASHCLRTAYGDRGTLSAMTKYFLMTLGLVISLSLVAQKKDGFVPIFDGKTLTGWECDTTYWRVENGNLVGEITPDKLLKSNTFIIWKGGEPADFELKLQFKISKNGNSGVNYRSMPFEGVPFALKGYQADIDGMNRYTGQNYEERGRTTLAYRGQTTQVNSASGGEPIKNNAWVSTKVVKELNRDSLQQVIKSEDWNELHLVIKGNRLQHYVNGVLMSDVTDIDQTNRKAKGLLGMQVHVGPPMKVEFRNIRLKQ